MAHQTEFNLNASVSHWKKTMLSDPLFTKENITELESHLLDEIHNLEGSGLTEEEAFIVAKRSIGEVKILASEYGKVNRKAYFFTKILPYLKGVLFFLAFTKFLNFLTLVAVLISRDFGADFTYLNTVSIGLLCLGSLRILIYALIACKQGNFMAGKLVEIQHW